MSDQAATLSDTTLHLIQVFAFPVGLLLGLGLCVAVASLWRALMGWFDDHYWDWRLEENRIELQETLAEAKAKYISRWLSQGIVHSSARPVITQRNIEMEEYHHQNRKQREKMRAMYRAA